MISIGIGSSFDNAGNADDGGARYGDAVLAAFELGPAWQGAQRAIFLRTQNTVQEVAQHLLRVLDDRDLLVVIEIGDPANVQFAGNRFDEEGFDAVFPAAAELEHVNRWRPRDGEEGQLWIFRQAPD
ncbi:hypothetical protein [Phenylobacterium sp. J367]|uniref:hypothetical protein n=1 Tax=Phenylobacterium sp. J367 TaxID=2898435 RepID=UPI0021510797|nr:hypothetical protein [Phenylobacterium sp. J367]MCR5877825.1 hypothetical protein [Phenylobacterium sp. J367]